MDTNSLASGASLVEAALPAIQKRFAHPDSDAELVAAGQRYVDSPAGATAAGAGVIAALVACDVGWQEIQKMRWLADVWVASRGVVFAAEAVVLATGLETGGYWSNGRQVEPVIRRRVDKAWGHFPHWLELASRVRAHLAVASDRDYAAAVAALEALREHSLEFRVAVSFLLPTQGAWVDSDCAAMAGAGRNLYLGKLLWHSVACEQHVVQVAPHLEPWWITQQTGALATAVEALGPRIAPQLLAWFDFGNLNAESQQRVLAVLAQFPTDEALGGLIARADRKYVRAAVLEAAKRFPRRALRLLAVAESRLAAEILRVHVLANRSVVEDLLASLPPHARERVEGILADHAAVAQASPEVLPAFLVTPPWTAPRSATKPPVITGLVAAGAPEIVWLDGEQQAWAERQSLRAHWWKLETSLETAIDQYRAGHLAGHHEVTLMATGPEELIRPLIRNWRPERVWDAGEWMPAVIARYGLDALPVAVHLAKHLPASCAGLLLPYASDEIAAFMADALARLKSLRSLGMAWFDRHAAFASRSLIPAAVGKPGAVRRAAEDALRIIAAHHRDEVVAAADGYGTSSRAAIDALIGADPLHLVPAKIPPLPAWADPALLPRVLLKDRTAVLGDDAARHLCTMLSISKPGDVYAGVPLVRDLCDERSLAEFGWALFEQWQAVGAPAKNAWPMQALRWLGDDEMVRRLSAVIRDWPGQGGHAKAVTGLEILAEIGTDLALMHLHGIAQKAKFKGLNERAGQKIAEVAAKLGFSADQLADRLVPDLGLDENGSMVLDYGARRFVVGFDEQLKPFVADEAGIRRKDLPKPGVRDDGALAPAAYRRFIGLKKDVRTIAADQIRRLEEAMVAQRHWTQADFRELFVAHPLLWHIVRRLVWIAHLDGGERVGFRVAEDRTFADVNDEALHLFEEATIGLAHPVHLGASIGGWSEVFADYELSQPFAQLNRSVYQLTDTELAATGLDRFAGRTWPATTLLGLERRGWRRGEPQDAGVQGWFWRATPDGKAIVIDLDPGIAVGALDVLPEQRIETIWVNSRPHGAWRPQELDLAFGVLDAITASETLRDLTEVLAR